MADYIVMPTLGFDMEEGTMGAWLKSVGDQVAKGDVLAEIESDKVTQELQARSEGTLLAILAEEGENIPVGANLGIIGNEGEDISGMMNGDGGSSDGAAAEPEPEPEPKETEATSQETAESTEAPKAAKPEPPRPTPAEGEGTADSSLPGGVRATPVARRIAEDNDVDLTQISGSGPDGRIRKADVEAYLEQPRTEKAPTQKDATEQVVVEVEAKPGTREEPLTRMRKAIARRMTESKTTVPHFQVTTEVDMDGVLKLRKQINETLDPEEKVSVNDLIVKAAALALRHYPNLNASFAGDKLIFHDEIHVGTAVAVEGGLLTIVMKNADMATMSTIARAHKEMIGRAREGKVMPEDIEGATFTVSNLGAFDVDSFTAIINPPNAAIIAVGSAKKVPVVVDGEISVGTRMKVTISADHRVTDGAEAAQYMQKFKQILEEPMKLLL